MAEDISRQSPMILSCGPPQNQGEEHDTKLLDITATQTEDQRKYAENSEYTRQCVEDRANGRKRSKSCHIAMCAAVI